MVRAARLTAEVGADGTDADVRVEYVLSGTDAAVESLPLEVLGVGPASVDSVRVEGAGRVAGPGGAIPLAPGSGSMRAATLPRSALALAADGATVTLTYRVTGAVERSGAAVRIRLPVLVVDLPPEQGGGPVFHASVRIPEGWSVSGGFPSGLAGTAEGAWETDLAVVPALVSLRGRSDGAWRPGLPEVLDVLALVVIFGFGLVGWRHLRDVAA